jgi:hypothetical protein
MKKIPQKVFHPPLIGRIIFPDMEDSHALNRNHSFVQHRYNLVHEGVSVKDFEN